MRTFHWNESCIKFLAYLRKNPRLIGRAPSDPTENKIKRSKPAKSKIIPYSSSNNRSKPNQPRFSPSPLCKETNRDWGNNSERPLDSSHRGSKFPSESEDCAWTGILLACTAARKGPDACYPPAPLFLPVARWERGERTRSSARRGGVTFRRRAALLGLHPLLASNRARIFVDSSLKTSLSIAQLFSVLRLCR